MMMIKFETLQTVQLPMADERLIGACCSLSVEEQRERLHAWRDLRDRARSVVRVPGGVLLAFEREQPMGAIAELMSAESECCAFYTFRLKVAGPDRQLEISAGTGGEPAVTALLGLEEERATSITNPVRQR
jgi:MerR family transcriptional regulator, copper efflux regulator